MTSALTYQRFALNSGQLPLSVRSVLNDRYLPFPGYAFPRFKQIVATLEQQMPSPDFRGNLMLDMRDFSYLRTVLADIEAQRKSSPKHKKSSLGINANILLLLINKLASMSGGSEQANAMEGLLRIIDSFASIERCLANKQLSKNEKTILFNELDIVFEEWLSALISAGTADEWTTVLKGYKSVVNKRLSIILKASGKTDAEFDGIATCFKPEGTMVVSGVGVVSGIKRTNRFASLYGDFKAKFVLGCHAIGVAMPAHLTVSMYFIRMLSELICKYRKSAKLFVEIIILTDLLQIPKAQLEVIMALLDFYCAVMQNSGSEPILRALITIAKNNAGNLNTKSDNITQYQSRRLVADGSMSSSELKRATQALIDRSEIMQHPAGIQHFFNGAPLTEAAFDGDQNSSSSDRSDKSSNELKKGDLVSKHSSGLTKGLNAIDKQFMERAIEYIHSLNLSPDETALFISALYALRKSFTIAGYTTLVTSIKYHMRVYLRGGKKPQGGVPKYTPKELVHGATNANGERILRPEFREDIFVQNICLVMMGYHSIIKSTIMNTFAS